MALSIAGTPCRLGKRPCWRSNIVVTTISTRQTKKTALKEKLGKRLRWTSYLHCNRRMSGCFSTGGTAKAPTFCWSPRNDFVTALQLDTLLWLSSASESGLIFASSTSLSQSSTNTASESMIAWWYIYSRLPLYCTVYRYQRDVHVVCAGVCVVCQRFYCGILK